MESIEIDNKDYLLKLREERGFYGSINDKPDTEQKLFKLQDEYLSRRNKYQSELKEWEKIRKQPKPERKSFRSDKHYIKAYTEWLDRRSQPMPVDTSGEVWSEMLGIVYSYTKSMVLKRNTGKIFMEPDEVSNKSIESALAFMNQYLRRDEFVCGASFSGLIKWKIVESLYKGHDDYHVSLNQLMSDDSGSDTLMEHIPAGMEVAFNGGSSVYNVEDDVLKEKPSEIIHGVLRELDEVIEHDSRLAFLCRLYMVIILRCPKTRHIKRLFLERWGEDYKTEQILESVQLELFERFEQESLFP